MPGKSAVPMPIAPEDAFAPAPGLNEFFNVPENVYAPSGDALNVPEDAYSLRPAVSDGGKSETTGVTTPAPAPFPTVTDALPKPTEKKDIRVRLAALNPGDVYSEQSGILAPLSQTQGMLFPYTPQIGFSQSVSYADLQLVHSNTDYMAYTRTPSVSITIAGKFTVQNQAEGKYALACLHFLRTVSKSYFGKLDGPKAGLPPPILLLNGYGSYMFNDLRVILKNHSWTFDENTDGINIVFTKGIARLPSLFTISCELTVVQTPKRMREQFSFTKFASGALMEKESGWI